MLSLVSREIKAKSLSLKDQPNALRSEEQDKSLLDYRSATAAGEEGLKEHKQNQSREARTHHSLVRIIIEQLRLNFILLNLNRAANSHVS